MQLRRLVLHNYCQHRHREFVFHSGLNAFTGPNGAGKTNAINAIIFALTGKTQNDGKKEDDICQLAGPDEDAYVDLELSHGGLVLEIHRVLRGSPGTWLKVTGEKKITGDTKVTTRIYELLQTTEQLITNYMFVARGELFRPFDPNVKPAERAVAFQRLVGTDKCEALWGAFPPAFDLYPAIAVPDLAAAEQRAAAAQKTLDDVRLKLAPTDFLEGWVAATSPEQAIVNAWDGAQTATSARDSAAASRRAIYPQRLAARAEIEQYEADIATFRQALTNSAKARADADATVMAQQVATATESVRQQVLQTRATAEAELQKLVPPALPAHGMAPAALQELIDQATAQILDDQRLIDNFAAKLDAAPDTPASNRCPTCGADAQHLVHEVPARQARVASLQLAKTAFQQQLQECRNYEQAMQRHAAEVVRLQGLMATPMAEHLRMPDPAEYAAALQLRSNASTWQAALSAAEYALPATQTRAAQLEQQATTLRQTQHAAKKRIVGDVPALAAVEAARATIASNAQLLLNRAELLGHQAAALATLTAAQGDVTAAKTAATAAQARTSMRTELEETRSGLHRDALPKALTEWHLRKLGVATNGVLKTFGTKFQLRSGDDPLSYTAVFADGRAQRASRLSGGESVMMGLAFRIAVNSQFAGNLGLLALDEPTAYLDRDNIGCLALALECLRKFSQTHGLQTILITHEEVGHLFDAVHQF